jgi:hypothetical protein
MFPFYYYFLLFPSDPQTPQGGLYNSSTPLFPHELTPFNLLPDQLPKSPHKIDPLNPPFGGLNYVNQIPITAPIGGVGGLIIRGAGGKF